MRIHWRIFNCAFIEADFIGDMMKKCSVCLKILKRKLHLSTSEGQQVTQAY